MNALDLTTARRPPRAAWIAVWIALAWVGGQASEAATCSQGNVPAATLLVPYFEVDLDAPGGQTTLFSVGNAEREPTIAFVTVWTDWGVPVVGFYIHIGANGVQTINLRDVLRDWQVPPLEDADPTLFPGCSNGAQTLFGFPPSSLRFQLTGQEEPTTGKCFSRPRGETGLAVGYVTVDVANDCVDFGGRIRDWFGQGFAGGANSLWGEVFYVDPDGNSSQGRNAVAVRNDPSREGLYPRFYANELPRVPLDEAWRTRYITGSGVGAATEIVHWMAGSSNGLFSDDGVSCGSTDLEQGLFYKVRFGPLQGPLMDPPPEVQYVPSRAITRKYRIDEFLPLDGFPENGVLEIEAWHVCLPCPIIPPDPFRLQSVAWPIFRADGRFSLAVEATPTAGSCGEEDAR